MYKTFPIEESSSFANPVEAFYVSVEYSVKLKKSMFIETGIVWKTYANGVQMSQKLANQINAFFIGTYFSRINTLQVPIRLTFSTKQFKKISLFGGVGGRASFMIESKVSNGVISNSSNYRFSLETLTRSFYLFEASGGIKFNASDNFAIKLRGEVLSGFNDFIHIDFTYISNSTVVNVDRISKGGYYGLGLGLSYSF